MEKDLELVLETIRKEHRRTQLVFGIGIIILTLVLTVTAPLAIRTAIDAQPTPDTSAPDLNPGPVAPGDTGASPAAPATSTSSHD